MVAPIAVRKHQLLLGNVNGVNKVMVDDEAPAQPDEVVTGIAELSPYQILNLTQLEGHKMLAVVLRHDMGIIPVCRHINQSAGGNAKQLRSF